MAQKLFQPFTKLPQQIQNLAIFQKIQGYTTGRHVGPVTCHAVSDFGANSSPSAMAYDEGLDLLAVASALGNISIYGAPGLVFTVDYKDGPISHLKFLHNEGRLVAATADNHVVLLELDAVTCVWSKVSDIEVPHMNEEIISTLAIGSGILYVGSSRGRLRQIAIHKGRMTLGDDVLTSLPCNVVFDSLAVDVRERTGSESAIVSIELHPGGDHLLIAYAAGITAVATPLSVPVEEPVAPVDEATAAAEPAVEDTPAEATTSESATDKKSEPDAEDKKPSTAEKKDENTLSVVKEEAKRKIRTLTMSIRHTLGDDKHKTEEKSSEPPLPVPPAPRVTHLLPHDQQLRHASWRITSLESPAVEVLTAYDDASQLIWPINASEGEGIVVVSDSGPVAIPYGPLPCCAIEKIVTLPSSSGDIITAFIGGLVRAQHADKHSITVQGGKDEHVCFQFGSRICDFIMLPSRPSMAPPASEEDAVVEHITCPQPLSAAGYLLVLTERELVAVDLTQPEWPVLPSPYLGCLDCTGITSMSHIAIPEELMGRLLSASNQADLKQISSQWPIQGGTAKTADGPENVDFAHNAFNDLLALGHADGNVTFWALRRGGCFTSLSSIHTASIFTVDELASKCETEGSWPPFRCVGSCRSHSGLDTDHRHAIHHIQLYLSTSQTDQAASAELIVTVGGGAGQVTVWKTDATASTFEPDVSRVVVDLLASEEHSSKYIWKDLEGLKPQEGHIQCCPTANQLIKPCELIQMYPPSPITAVAFEPMWQVLAVGSAHGFTLVDLLTRSPIHSQLTASENTEPIEPAAGLTSTISNRGRQIKATLRQSFRRLKKPKSAAATAEDGTPTIQEAAAATASAAGEAVEDGVKAAVDGATEVAKDIQADITTTVQEKVETVVQSVTEGVSSVVAGNGTDSPQQATEAEVVEATPAEPIALTAADSAPFSIGCLAFADTYVISPVVSKDGKSTTPSPKTASMFVGTKGGAVIIHTLTWPQPAKGGPVTVSLVKELQLKHAAPLIGFVVLDAKTHAPLGKTEKHRLTAEALAEEKPTESPPTEAATESTPSEAAPEVKSPEEEAPVEDSDAKTKVSSDKPPAAPEASAPIDAHELLVCSEEQVKLFTLPSLRARHKYRFWDKTTVGHAAKPPPAVHPEAAAPTEVAQAPAAEEEQQQPKPEIEEPKKEAPCCTAPPKRRVWGFGVQNFPLADESAAAEWHAVVALTNGYTTALALPNLRKVAKGHCCQFPGSCCGSTPPCVSNSANLILWPSTVGQVFTNEISRLPPHRLASALATPKSAAGLSMNLPEWSRPAVKVFETTVAEIVNAAEATATGAVDQANAATESGVKALNATVDSAIGASDAAVNSAQESAQKAMNSATQQVNKLNDDLGKAGSAVSVGAQHAGDITMDSIKEYFNDEGTVTVKTTESSLEKRTVIESGQVITTVHETELVDGEVTKDDIVQVKSIGDAAASAITGSA